MFPAIELTLSTLLSLPCGVKLNFSGSDPAGAEHRRSTPLLEKRKRCGPHLACTNNAYAAVMTHAPTQFASFGVLPLPHVDAALNEIDRIPDLPDFVGIALGASAQRIPIDDLTFAP